MPKLKPSAQEEANNITRGHIWGNMYRHRTDEEMVAKSIGVSKRTLYNRKNNPETFTLEELQKLAKKIKLSPLQAASIVLGRELTKQELKEINTM